MAGAEPSFTEVHLLRTLLILDTETIGRKKLVKSLGVGEGSVRTIIKKLAAEGLLSSSKAGHNLTSKGKAEVSSRLDHHSKPIPFDLGTLVTGSQSLIVVYGAASKASKAVGLRDAALKAGADGALIFAYDQGYKLPGMDLKEYPEAFKSLRTILIKDGDAVVVGFAATAQKAEDGAIAAALKMIP